ECTPAECGGTHIQYETRVANRSIQHAPIRTFLGLPPCPVQVPRHLRLDEQRESWVTPAQSFQHVEGAVEALPPWHDANEPEVEFGAWELASSETRNVDVVGDHDNLRRRP